MNSLVIVKWLILKIVLSLNLCFRAQSIVCIKIDSLALVQLYFYSQKNDSCFVSFKESFEASKVTSLKFLVEISSELLMSSQNESYFGDLNNFVVFFSEKSNSHTFYEPIQAFSCQNLNCDLSIFLPQNLSFEKNFNFSRQYNYKASQYYDRCFFVSENQYVTIESYVYDDLASFNEVRNNFCVGPNVRLGLNFNLKKKSQNLSELFNVYGNEKSTEKNFTSVSKLDVFIDQENLRDTNEFSINLYCKNNLEINLENILVFKKNASILNSTSIWLDECILSANLLKSFTKKKNGNTIESSTRKSFSFLSNQREIVRDLETFLLKIFCNFNSCYFEKISECIAHWQNQTFFGNTSEICFFNLNSSRFSKEINQMFNDLNDRFLSYENNSKSIAHINLQNLLLHVKDFQQYKLEQSKLSDLIFFVPIAFFSIMSILFIIYVIIVTINRSSFCFFKQKINIKDSKILGLEKKKIRQKNVSLSKSTSESITIKVDPKNYFDMEKNVKLNLKSINHKRNRKLMHSKSCNQLKSKIFLSKQKSLDLII